MGVRGLTSYIADNSQLYLKRYELSQTYLVVDGSNIASHLYKWMSKSDSVFGGDYDEYYKTVKNFFIILKKCQVIPIVLFDGGYEKRKLKTILSRSAAKLPILRSFSRNFSTAKFFPLFMKQTFFDVMEELNVLCVQCCFEADDEIAALARILNCPVLSYDSDFYIYDVLYIPFSSIIPKVVTVEDPENKVRHYVECSLYDIENFLNEFSGLDKSHLPIMATLLGNDYIDSSIFHKFFNHVIIPKNKKLSYTQRKIQGVLHWLKTENVESAKKLILSHLENKHAVKVLNAINLSIKEYTNVSISPSLIPILKKLSEFQINHLNKFDQKSNIHLPPVTQELFYKCRLHKFIIDLMTLKCYFTHLQVENVFEEPSYFHSLPLIKAIYSIIKTYADFYEKPKSLKVYLIMKNHYGTVTLENDTSDNISKYSLDNVLSISRESRLKVLFEILGFSESDEEIVKCFNNSNWTIFIISYIYWIKKVKNSISLAHTHAFILMVIANQVVQKKVGYFRKYSKFLKKKEILLKSLKSDEIKVNEDNNRLQDFKTLLERVTLNECLIVQQMLIPLRQTVDKARGKSYCISVIHLFASFQSCLYHIFQINVLLNYPLPHLKISDFYSGTLLFNFYLSIINKNPVNKFGCQLFQETPNLLQLFKYLCELLSKYSGEETKADVKKKKKGKKNREAKRFDSSDENDFFIKIPEDDGNDDSDYSDENNLFSVLRKTLP